MLSSSSARGGGSRARAAKLVVVGDNFFLFIVHYRAKNRGSSLRLKLYRVKPAWTRWLNAPQTSKG